MSESRRTVPGRYARAVERRWARLCGRAVILSERDWALIEDWHLRAIPLQIIEEAIDAAIERRARGRGGSRPPRGLAYIANAVEEAWRTVLDGRVEEAGAEGRPESGRLDGLAAWRTRLREEPRESELRRLLGELVEALDCGESPDRIDARLDREIIAAAPGSLRRKAEEEVGRQLEEYAGRMKKDALEATRLHAQARRLREWLGLPRLERSRDE